MSENGMQIEYWNGAGGERFARSQDAIDRSLAKITEAAISFAAPQTDERVLDIGCGCGTTTFRLREKVGPNGAAAGVDVSKVMLNVARARAGASNADVAFVEDDAARHDFQPVFDLVFSRFGVMFFADPVAAFANIRTALTKTGRMAFVCWRSLPENFWAYAPLVAARPFLPPMDPPDPHAPGPFAFADGDRLHRILSSAGFNTIAIEKLDTTMSMGATVEEASAEALNIGPVSRAASELDEPARDKIRAAITEAFSNYNSPEGVSLPSACWLVRATV
ncbi:MAG TPA: methyltransferase domain-containing protein [Rhizomicrobium sp.]|nr:methyltransferase domain-containing protein [Rhizomicrobium sp.]